MNSLRIILTLGLLLSCFCTKAQQAVIELNKDNTTLKTTGFLITTVRDARKDTTNIGYTLSGRKRVPLTLKNGASATLLSFFNSNTLPDSASTAVELVIQALEVSERTKRGNVVAHILMKYAFAVAGEQQLALTYEADVPGGKEALERAINKQTEKLNTQFSKWFAENKEKILAKPSITVGVTVGLSSTKNKDLIFYNKRRKLTYNDFQHKPERRSRYAAETASGMYIEASGLTMDKHVILKVKVASSFNKKLSWFKKDAKNRYVLDHEQLHFDVTAYCTCEFVKALRTYPFTPQNYEKEMEQLRKQYEATTSKMQDEYDWQTNHGLVKDKQAEWRIKINELLATQDCYDQP
jgi:hypothetical protein